MKKFIFLAILVAMTFFSSKAQVYSFGNYEGSLQGENAFLDPSFSYSDDPNNAKGLIFPTVDLVNFEFIITGYATDFAFTHWFNGMVVYNTATGKTKTAGNRSSTETQVEPGFYYFYNPNATNVNTGEWLPLGSGSTPAEGTIKYDNGDYKYWDDGEWKDLPGQGIVPPTPTPDPSMTIGLAGGKTAIMVGEIINLTAGESVTWAVLPGGNSYAEIVNINQLKGLAVGSVTVRATTSSGDRYKDLLVTVSDLNPDGSGNLVMRISIRKLDK